MKLRTPLGHCRFNMHKGMWETQPWHWVVTRVLSIMVAFPAPTALERGVSPDGGEL